MFKKIKKFIRFVLCKIFGHKWEAVEWYSKAEVIFRPLMHIEYSTKTIVVNTRKDICTKCNITRIENDETAPEVLRNKTQLWIVR